MPGGINQKVGFERIGVKKLFWKEEGIAYPECGTVCFCSAALYKKSSKGSVLLKDLAMQVRLIGR